MFRGWWEVKFDGGKESGMRIPKRIEVKDFRGGRRYSEICEKTLWEI